MSASRKSERLHMSVTPETKEKLKEIQEKEGLATLTDVVRKALRLYRALLALEDSGGEIYCRSPDGEEERILFL